MAPDSSFRCGYIALVGRPNVGKSTLLNRLLGQKISITADRPQTTRHRILGIKTESDYQAIFIDTPGLHSGGKRALNRYMNRAAGAGMAEADVVALVVERTRWSEEERHILERMPAGVPVVLVINKVDALADKSELLPHLQALAQQHAFTAIVPIAALTGDGVPELEQTLVGLLPSAPPLYDESQVTDRSERFIAAELVREKLTRALGQELPYASTVEIERFTEERGMRHINALIWVEREGQKAIIIGSKGERLKSIGEQARKDMERIFDGKVFLELWVRVKRGWSDDERALRSLGYDET